MNSWAQRSHEERVLLNPGFCANLIWHAALGYADESGDAMSFEESFLVLPFVLHRETRGTLPRDTRTSLATWLNDYPLSRSRIATRAQLLAPFAKEAIIFAGVHGFIRLEEGKVSADPAWKKSVIAAFKDSSDEVRSCINRSSFVGKWFAKTGNAATIFALIGVQP